MSRVRRSSASYFKNLIESGHGSVMEHSVLNFIFADVCCERGEPVREAAV